jgi:CheY-like chemotaxis protein
MISNAAEQRLLGLQVFVVEDELLVSIMLEDMLADFGCIIAGVAATIDQALSMVKATEVIDAAILDVNIGGEMIFPVADLLLERNIPCVFSTGYGPIDLDARYPVCRRLNKPYAAEDMAAVLADVARDRPQGDRPGYSG